MIKQMMVCNTDNKLEKEQETCIVLPLFIDHKSKSES